MRFLSIAAFATLIATSHIAAYRLEVRESSKCNPGKGRTSKGNCEDCNPGTFSVGGPEALCQTCPVGSTSGEEASSCYCRAGFFINGGTTTSAACNTCPAGSSSSTRSSSCSPCSANTYSFAGGACIACPTGSASPPGSSVCSCAAGAYLSNGLCNTCTAGSYSSAGATSCTLCPAGTFSGTNGASSCTTCPLGTSSAEGSASCGPQPSRRAQPFLSAAQMCNGVGYQRCDVLSDMGGSECINIFTTLDSCGGCVGPEGEEEKYSGRDCSAIAYVDRVNCQAGRCNITSCQAGYEPSGGFCVPSISSEKDSAARISRSAKRRMFSRYD